MTGRASLWACGRVLLLAAWCGGSAFAQPNEYLRLEIADSTNVGTYVVGLQDAWWEIPGQRLVWRLDDGPISILDDVTGEPVATLVTCELALQFAPRAAVELTCGVLGSDEMTDVRLQSPVLQFDTVDAADAFGRARVSFYLADGPDGFAEMTSLATPVGTGAFRARYNGAGELGEMFAHLVWQVSIEGEPGQSAGAISVDQASPSVGFAPIGADVSDMSVDVSYSLTPGDAVVVTSSFELDRSVQPACPGDLNFNGEVDLGDLGLMLSSFGECGSGDHDPVADLSGDQCVNVTDLGILLAVFGTGC